MNPVDSARPISDLTIRLHASDSATRRQAAEELLQSGVSAAGVAPLALKALVDTDEGVREALVGWLEDCGAPSGDDLAALLPLLTARDDDVVYWTITLLGRLGSDGAGAVGGLGQKLGESNPPAIRERAAWALGRIGPAAATIRPALEKLTTCNSPRLSRLAAEALREMGS